jgi:hypothetical protein
LQRSIPIPIPFPMQRAAKGDVPDIEMRYPPHMNAATRNRLVLGAALLIAGGILAYNMFFALTPPRHADHDHAIAKLDAGGFLWIESTDGDRRNLVGVPEKVLVLHFFDPQTVDLSEQEAAARFAATVSNDPLVDMVFIAQAPSWEGVEAAAESVGIPSDHLYLDQESRTSHLCGVRRIPETLVFDPAGFLAYQARGAVAWSEPGIRAQIERAKGGVDEIH